MTVQWTQKIVVSVSEVFSNLVASVVAGFRHLPETVRWKLVTSVRIKRISREVGCSIAMTENLKQNQVFHEN